MSKRKNPYANANTIHVALSDLRKKTGWGQDELAVRLSEYMGRSKVYTIGNISAWETGRRTPPVNVIAALADIYGVTIDDIIGETEPTAVVDHGSIIRDITKEAIPVSEYYKYHKKPVFVVFVDKTHTDQWAFLNYDSNSLLLTSAEIVRLNQVRVELYPLQTYDIPSYYKRNSKPISIQRMMASSQVWVEMMTSDQSVRALYNGWYIHNGNHSALIKPSSGLVLPYQGYGVSYKPYAVPLDIL